MRKKSIAAEVAAAPGAPEASFRSFIEIEVERALAPYGGLFPPDVIDAFRERLAVFYASHPAMADITAAAWPRAAGEGSGVVETSRAVDRAASNPEDGRTGKGKGGDRR